MTESSESDRVTQDEVREFLQKLDGWAATLNAGDRALLQLVVEQSAGRLGESVDLSFPAGEGVGQVLEPFLSEKARNMSIKLPAVRPARPKAWVELGEPWIQSV